MDGSAGGEFSIGIYKLWSDQCAHKHALTEARRAVCSSERSCDRLPAACRRDQRRGMTPSLFRRPVSHAMPCTPTRRLFLAGAAASALARASAEARPVVVGSKLDLEGGL